MEWKISYYNENLKEEIQDLPSSLAARYLRMTELMIKEGPDIGMPHTRAMGKGLFELRLKGKEGISRVFYCVVIDKRIFMLHSIIKKTQETPQRDIAIARSRMEEVTNYAKRTSSLSKKAS